MDTFPKRNSNRRLFGSLALMYVGLLLPVSGQPSIPFAEDIFPELETLIDEAIYNSAQLKINFLRIEEREGDLDVARGSRLPRAYVSAQALGNYETRDDIGDRTRGTLNANFRVTQPLYQWNALKRRQTIAENRIVLEELEAERQGSSQLMELRRAYLQWILLRERKAILEQSIELSSSYVTARRRLVEAGLSSEQDVLEIEAQLMESRESLAYVDNAIGDMENQFRRFAGEDFSVDSLKGDSLSRIQPLSDEEFEQLARQVRNGDNGYVDPLTARWGLLEDNEDEQIAIIEKRNWPTVDFVAGLYTDQLDSINQRDYVFRMQYFAGLQVSWNVFDGWLTDGFKRSALARKRTFALLHEEAANNKDNQVETLLAKLRLNQKQIEARGKREVLLERRVTLLRQQVEQDLVSGFDLMRGEVDYLEVRRNLMEARVNYLMNLMELGVLIGEDPAVSKYKEVE